MFYQLKSSSCFGFVLFLTLTVAGLNAFGFQNNARADDPVRVIRHDVRIVVQPNGDLCREEKLVFPPQAYSEAKDYDGGPVQIYRSLQKSTGWSLIEDFKPAADDESHRVIANFKQLGAARPLSGDRWYLELDSAAEMELIAVNGTELVLAGAADSIFGVMSHTTRLKLPSGSSNPKPIAGGRAIEFEYRPNNQPGAKTATNFRLDAKQHLMTSMASVYANRDFEEFWTARSVFRNEGDQTIRNYRIRFRIAGHSNWSEWARTATVVPGQTVIDPFFPVFEMDSITHMTTSRVVMIETEFEYQTADGNTVEDTDSHRIELLSRNQVVFSSRPDGENVNFLEENDQIPYIVAAFCNSDDPVVQQLAGRISGMANGPASSLDSEDAIVYLSTFWNFLTSNGISYQTPPGFSLNGTSGQHIKYPRDVLQNRAGTCVDLAILWAAVGKAVGLETHLVVTEDHAFPIIALPNGETLPIETTLLGKGAFEDAVSFAVSKLHDLTSSAHHIVSIDEMQAKGARCIDLAPVSDTWLNDLNYRFEAVEPDAEDQAEEDNSEEVDDQGDDVADAPLIAEESEPLPPTWMGLWRLDTEIDGESILAEINLLPSGHATFTKSKKIGGEYQVEIAEEVFLSLQADKLRMRSADGEIALVRYELEDDTLTIVGKAEGLEIGAEFTKVAMFVPGEAPDEFCHAWRANPELHGKLLQFDLEITPNGEASIEIFGVEDGKRVLLESLTLNMTFAGEEVLFENGEGIHSVRKCLVEGDTLRWFSCDSEGNWELLLEFKKLETSR